MADLNSKWVIPLIRNNSAEKKVPTFLNGRLYIDFNDDSFYEPHYEELLRELLDEPVLPIPELGESPFKTAQKFIPSSERDISPSLCGEVTFDCSNNDGRYSIGQGSLLFEVRFSKASNSSIYVYRDASSIESVALVKDKSSIGEIADARVYDNSSRVRNVNIDQIVILKNKNGFFAAIKVLSIKDDSRGDDTDEVTFEYQTQSNGSSVFKAQGS